MHHPTAFATDDGNLLFADCAKQAHERLVEIGCKVDGKAKPEQTITTYFAVKRRLIAKRPRRIFIAKNLSVPAEHECSFHEIMRKAEVGEDLTPYQSRRLLLNPNQGDALLTDWGVQHLHFDAGLNPKKRSSELMFARITDDAFYCIDISDHRGFTRQVMLEILDGNWPESIAAFLLRGGIVGESITDEQVGNLRTANVNVFVRLPNGRAYVYPGGGRTCSGENALDIRACAQVARQCRDAAKATAIDGLQRVFHLPTLR
jgi:hypothetical protein